MISAGETEGLNPLPRSSPQKQTWTDLGLRGERLTANRLSLGAASSGHGFGVKTWGPLPVRGKSAPWLAGSLALLRSHGLMYDWAGDDTPLTDHDSSPWNAAYTCLALSPSDTHCTAFIAPRGYGEMRRAAVYFVVLGH